MRTTRQPIQVLDDMNEKVRKSAQMLAKTMSRTSIRLCNAKYTEKKSIPQAIDSVLPMLLDKGLNNPAKEVRAISIATVLKITRIAGPPLRPHLSVLMRALLEGQTNLEPASFSYLQFHTSSFNITPEKLEQIRLSIAKSSPLAEALDQCVGLIDSAVLPQVLSMLSELIRAGLGLATLSGCARLITNLGMHVFALCAMCVNK